MKRTILFLSLIITSHYSYAACQSGTPMTIDDFKYMDRKELATYYCKSKSLKEAFINLAHNMKNTMPDMAENYAKTAKNCTIELRRIPLVLKKDHQVPSSNLEEMDLIMDGEPTGDNIQRCEAVII
jgi:hypothetical protein